MYRKNIIVDASRALSMLSTFFLICCSVVLCCVALCLVVLVAISQPAKIGKVWQELNFALANAAEGSAACCLFIRFIYLFIYSVVLFIYLLK